MFEISNHTPSKWCIFYGVIDKYFINTTLTSVYCDIDGHLVKMKDFLEGLFDFSKHFLHRFWDYFEIFSIYLAKGSILELPPCRLQ